MAPPGVARRAREPSLAPPPPGGVPPSWEARQLFSSWWIVPLETVPRGLFSPPTRRRAVINTATNAHDANWQRDVTRAAAPTQLGQLLSPLASRSVCLGSNCSVSYHTCQWLVFVFGVAQFRTCRWRRCSTGCDAASSLCAAWAVSGRKIQSE